MKFILINAAGDNIQRFNNIPSEDFLPPVPEGFSYASVDEGDDLDAMEAILTENGLSVRVREIPDGEMVERQQAQLWEAVKGERERRINAGVVLEIEPGVSAPFDSDAPAQANLLAGVMAANIPAIAAAEFPKEWTLADNSKLILTAEQMVTVGGLVISYVSACHNRARNLRDLLNAATTLEDLEAIAPTISTGWPGQPA